MSSGILVFVFNSLIIVCLDVDLFILLHLELVEILGIVQSCLSSNFGHFWMLFFQIMFLLLFLICFRNSYNMFVGLLKRVLQVP